MAEVASQISNKMSGVAHSAAARAKENRPLTIVGLGLLAVGAGAGIWALIKKISAESPTIEPDFEPDDFRRSGQY